MNNVAVLDRTATEFLTRLDELETFYLGDTLALDASVGDDGFTVLDVADRHAALARCAERISNDWQLAVLAEATEQIATLPTLTPGQRTALTLHYLDGLSIVNIATRLGVSPQIVSAHLVRGIEKLKQHFRLKGFCVPS